MEVILPSFCLIKDMRCMGWDRLSEAEKAEYRALHDEFIARSGEMLKEYERSINKKLELQINAYIENVDGTRKELESKSIE